MQREILSVQEWSRAFLSYAAGGIFMIISLNFCFFTSTGKLFVRQIKKEIRDCLKEINWRSFTQPFLLMSGVYLLGILTIIRANFLYLDDIPRTIEGNRGWYGWSRYVAEIFSVFMHADSHLTDISPLPQLLAILFLAIGSVILVYVLTNKKITIIALIASIPIGLSPYMLECLSYKYDAPYMALSVLAGIIPFLFLARKRAFVFCSVISLLIMCMTYQAASGIYLMITLFLCFNDWNGKRKTNREVFLFLGQATLSFCITMLIFRLFLMKPTDTYVSTSILPVQQMISGTLTNLQTYIITVNFDFGFIWKVIIGIIFFFFITKSFRSSQQNKMISLLVTVLFLCLLLLLSYGVYSVLARPLFQPRALYGIGIFLAIISIYIVSNFNKLAKIAALALSWSFFVFAFSYGNAWADQMRYANFRIGILLHDLSVLFPDKDKDENEITIQLKNGIGYTPFVKNTAKHNPIIYKLGFQMMQEDDIFFTQYSLEYFNFFPRGTVNRERILKSGERLPYIDFNTLNLPVVLKTYYHTIKSDGKRVLVELNEGVK